MRPRSLGIRLGPHFGIVFRQVSAIAGETRIAIERNLKLWVRQFFHNIENVPMQRRLVHRVLYGLDVDVPELLSPMVEALFVGMRSRDCRIPAATFVIPAASWSFDNSGRPVSSSCVLDLTR